MQTIFQTAAALVSLYTTLCFIRIIITWIPGVQYSAFGKDGHPVADGSVRLVDVAEKVHTGTYKSDSPEQLP